MNKTNTKARKQVKSWLNRIAGSVAGIRRTAEQDLYCIDVLTQIAAVRSALDAIGVELLTNHLEGCIFGHGTGTEHHCARPLSQKRLIDEMRATLGRFLQ
jgi:DNA-binding FrmR family transcriptional regulator